MADYVVEFGKDGGRREADGRLDAPAFHRNHQAIYNVLERFLAGKSGEVIEVGSGTGQHTIAFAREFPKITWWPSDLNEQHLVSIEAWRAHSQLANIQPARRIDLSDAAWCDAMKGEARAFSSEVEPVRVKKTRQNKEIEPPFRFNRNGKGSGSNEWLAIFCANVVHIAPWLVAEGLFAGAGRILRKGGMLFLYGPFKRGGRHTAASNEAFDASLRQRNGEWGVRDLEAVEALAESAGLALIETVEMPANNLTLVFRRA